MLTFVRRQTAIVGLFLVLASVPMWSKTFLRWTEAEAPSPERLGVNELTVPWDAGRISTFVALAKQGYKVYAEASQDQASEAARAIAEKGLSGVILDRDKTPEEQIAEMLRKLRAAYPKLIFRVLNSNGQQPQMRSRLVINRNGILEVTSSTAQPWIDTNLALVKLESAFHSPEVPLYRFHWDFEKNEQLPLPTAEDYGLAIAEAVAFDADVVLPLAASLQKEMGQNSPVAWELWNQVRRYLDVVPQAASHDSDSNSNVGVLTDNSGASYEPLNLMARHNILFRVLPPQKLNEASFEHLDVLIVFVTPDARATQPISTFASNGGTAVLVDSHASYPWHSTQPVRNGEASASYPVGKGRVIELSEPVADPESFAQDIRRLVGNQKIELSLWNALTTVAVLHRSGHQARTLELLNYAEEPVRVQVRVKGIYATIRYGTPEHGCCESLKATHHDGFTEFVIPSLRVAARVHLGSKGLDVPKGR
jgi:hypothetical protein